MAIADPTTAAGTDGPADLYALLQPVPLLQIDGASSW